MWETLLEGSLILGVLTAVIGILKDKMDRKLQYITSERTKWREEIRGIASKLQTEENIFKIEDILCELKARINTYGIVDKDNFFKDGHIWKIIRTLEENPHKLQGTNRHEEIKKAKKTLIGYLSCLLKYDWERSKMEVIGNRTSILCVIDNIVFFVGIVICSTLVIGFNVKDFNINSNGDYAFITTVMLTGVVAVINFIVMYLDINIKNMQDDFIKAIIDKKSFVWLYIKKFKWPIIYTVLWCAYIVFISKYGKDDFLEERGIIFFGGVIWFYLYISGVIYYLKINNEKKNYTNYYDAINKIYEMEMCPNDCVREPNDCVREDCPRIGKDCCR